MKFNDKLTAQINDFFFHYGNSQEITENTRVLTTAMAYSEHFDTMDKLQRVEILHYLHKIEDLLLALNKQVKEDGEQGI